MRSPRSTFGLVLLASLAIAGATLVLGAVVYETSHEALEKQLDHRIETESTALMHQLDQGGVQGLAAAISQREDGRRARGMGYLLVDPAGRRIAGRLNATAPEPGWREFLWVESASGDRQPSQALTTQLPDGSKLVVAADRTPIDEIDGTILRLFMAAFGAMLAVGVGSAWALGSIIRRRLERINATAQAIIAGDVTRRMPRDGTSSEFDQLSETLNRMLDRNAELLENLQQVSSDIAHDLRTPLSRLQQALDAALVAPLDGDGYRRAIQLAAERSGEMLDLFAALLRISEVETLQVREGFQALNLSELVERVADAFRPDVENIGHRLSVAIEPGIDIEGDRHLLSQLLVNLIENATRHTPEGTHVSIALVRHEGRVELSVADDGPGIADQHRDLVLRRFARLEQSRSTPGHGLGLSLARAIAQAHYGSLILSDNRPGLRVETDLPLNRPGFAGGPNS